MELLKDIIFVVVVVLVAATAYAVGYDHHRRKAARDMDFHRRPIERREDAQRATRDPQAVRRPARVTTAHMSQPRRSWNPET